MAAQRRRARWRRRGPARISRQRSPGAVAAAASASRSGRHGVLARPPRRSRRRSSMRLLGEQRDPAARRRRARPRGSGRGCAAPRRWPGCRSSRWSRGSRCRAGRRPVQEGRRGGSGGLRGRPSWSHSVLPRRPRSHGTPRPRAPLPAPGAASGARCPPLRVPLREYGAPARPSAPAAPGAAAEGAHRPGAPAIAPTGRGAPGGVSGWGGGRCRAWPGPGSVGDPGPLVGWVEDALLQPGDRPVEHGGGEPAVGVVGVVHSAVNSSSTRMRACRQKVSASYRASAPCAPVAARCSARTHAALIANSSAPMSTIRPRKSCFGTPACACQRDIA